MAVSLVWSRINRHAFVKPSPGLIQPGYLENPGLIRYLDFVKQPSAP